MQKFGHILIVMFAFVFASIGFSACGNKDDDDFTPAELTEIKVTTKPTKVQYLWGEAFNTYGMVVTAYYSNGTSAVLDRHVYTVTVANQDIDGKFSTDGPAAITVAYDTETDAFDVNVYKTYDEMRTNLGTITRLEIESRPVHEQVEVGGAIDDYLEGLIIREYMSSGVYVKYEYNKYIKDRYVFTGFDSSEPNEYQVIEVRSAVNPDAPHAEFTFEIVASIED